MSPKALGSITSSASDVTLRAESLPEFKTDPHVLTSQGNPISGVVRGMFQDSLGRLWFATQNGVALQKEGSLVYLDIRDRYGQGVTAKAIVEDHRGHIWIGSTGGLSRYDGEHITTFFTEDGLVHDDVWALFVDREGLLWIGTYGGVSRFDGETFTRFAMPEGPERNATRGIWGPAFVWSITGDRAGNTWLSGASGVHRYDGKELTRFAVMEGDSSTYVNSVLEDHAGHLWFATHAKGLIRFDGATFTQVTRSWGIEGREIGTLSEDREGNLWVPVKGAGVYRFDGSSFTQFREKDGLRSMTSFYSFVDRSGRVWVGGMRGAYRFTGTRFIHVTRAGPW